MFTLAGLPSVKVLLGQRYFHLQSWSYFNNARNDAKFVRVLSMSRGSGRVREDCFASVKTNSVFAVFDQ